MFIFFPTNVHIIITAWYRAVTYRGCSVELFQVLLRGIRGPTDIGQLSLFEHYGSCKVCTCVYINKMTLNFSPRHHNYHMPVVQSGGKVTGLAVVCFHSRLQATGQFSSCGEMNGYTWCNTRDCCECVYYR